MIYNIFLYIIIFKKNCKGVVYIWFNNQMFIKNMTILLRKV